MKNLFLLLIALLLIVVFGGSAYFLWETSQNAKFERSDLPPANDE